MKDIRFSVGMALFDTPPVFYESTRAFFTAMSALIHHPLVNEIVIVDNDPHPYNPLANMEDKTRGKVRYIKFPEPKGTAAPRNHIFEVAKNDYVVCMDPHVLLYPGSIEAIRDAYEDEGWNSPDLFHGVMMTEWNEPMATHMNDQWRAEMLGTWGIGWVSKKGMMFSTLTRDNNRLEYVSLNHDGEQRLLTSTEIEWLGLNPNLGWPGHEAALKASGCAMTNGRFKIPGHGMGFFACRKDSWLPFHKDCRGFGGEEITTGIRFRQAGRSSWCVTDCKWLHHFDRPQGIVPYPLNRFDKVRNYVLEFRKLGLDIEVIHRHFQMLLPPSEWDQIVAGAEWPALSPGVNPASYAPSREAAHERAKERGNRPAPKSGCGSQTASRSSLEHLYSALYAVPSPIRDDLPHLHHLAATCGPDDSGGDVVEIVHQSVSGAAIMAGRPKSLTCFGEQGTERRAELLHKIKPATIEYRFQLGVPAGIPQCDMLFLDTDPHTAENYTQLLNLHESQVRRYIVIHDSIAYGDSFNGQPGVIPAVQQFLRTHGDWQEVIHYKGQNGLLVLSRNPEDAAKLASTVYEVPPPPPENRNVQPQPGQTIIKVPEEGPGTELALLLKSIGVQPKPSCDCNAKQAQMNLWGNDKTEENFDTVVGWMEEGSDRWSWTEKVKIAARAIANGLAFKLDPLHPYKSIVAEAIARSRQKEKENNLIRPIDKDYLVA